MDSKSDIIKLMSYDNANEVVNELFESLFFKIRNCFRNINERE